MRATGATRVRVGTVKQGEYTAECVVAGELTAVTNETIEAVRVSLLERCQAATGITESDFDDGDDIPF